jgi:hypothetical protein
MQLVLTDLDDFSLVDPWQFFLHGGLYRLYLPCHLLCGLFCHLFLQGKSKKVAKKDCVCLLITSG